MSVPKATAYQYRRSSGSRVTSTSVPHRRRKPGHDGDADTLGWVSSTWLESASAPTTAGLTALRPELGDLIARFQTDSATAIGARLHDLLAARVAQLVGDAVGIGEASAAIAEQARSWPTHPEVSDVERVALELCECFIMDVHSVTDDQVGRLAELLGNDGAVAVLMDLALLDGFTKFRRVFSEGDD